MLLLLLGQNLLNKEGKWKTLSHLRGWQHKGDELQKMEATRHKNNEDLLLVSKIGMIYSMSKHRSNQEKLLRKDESISLDKSLKRLSKHTSEEMKIIQIGIELLG